VVLLLHEFEQVHAQSVGMLFKQRVHEANEFVFVFLIEHILSDLHHLVLLEPTLDLVSNMLGILFVVLVVDQLIHTVLVSLLDDAMLLSVEFLDQHTSLSSAGFQSRT